MNTNHHILLLIIVGVRFLAPYWYFYALFSPSNRHLMQNQRNLKVNNNKKWLVFTYFSLIFHFQQLYLYTYLNVCKFYMFASCFSRLELFTFCVCKMYTNVQNVHKVIIFSPTIAALHPNRGSSLLNFQIPE